MRPLAEADLRAVLDALGANYAQGRSSDFHVLTFTKTDGSVVRGTVAWRDDPDGAPGVLVNADGGQVTVPWGDIRSLLIEAD
jgi:hypothetical protein